MAGNRVNLKDRTCGHDDDTKGRVMEISHLRSIKIKSYSVKNRKKTKRLYKVYTWTIHIYGEVI